MFSFQKNYNEYNNSTEASSEIEDHFETPIDLIVAGIAAYILSESKKVL